MWKPLFLPVWPPCYVISGGEYSEDDVSELVKEDEVDGDEQTQKTKGKKRKAQSIPARWCCPRSPWKLGALVRTVQIAGIGPMLDFLLPGFLTFFSLREVFGGILGVNFYSLASFENFWALTKTKLIGSMYTRFKMKKSLQKNMYPIPSPCHLISELCYQR